MPTWIQFFKDASIPPKFAGIYAAKFTENRIRFDMLGDIDKHLLNEMGINAIGINYINMYSFCQIVMFISNKYSN